MVGDEEAVTWPFLLLKKIQRKYWSYSFRGTCSPAPDSGLVMPAFRFLLGAEQRPLEAPPMRPGEKAWLPG